MLNTNLLRLRRNFSSILIGSRKYVTNAETQENVKEPVYPPILDLSRKAVLQRKKDAWHAQIREVKTVEEKIFKLNMPNYYGFNSVLINPAIVPYNALPLAKHYTRTCFIEQDHLHDYYKQNEEKANRYVSMIKDDIQEALVFAYKGYTKGYELKKDLTASEIEDKLAATVIFFLNRVILNRLSHEENHLFESDLDLEPRHEAFWVVGGIDPPTRLKKARRGLEWLKPEADAFVDRNVQYLGKPIMTMRCEHPLEPVVPYDSAVKGVYEVPHFKYDPRVLGYTHEFRHATNIPGFWPGDSQEFGLLSYHTRKHNLGSIRTYNTEDDQDALHVQGIIHSFAWLMAQANYQGFNTFNDVTYPLTAQTILTNGHKFSFYTYQLNTTLMHSENYANNEKVNLCWGTKEMELFEKIDDEGNLINFNEDVLKFMVQYYINLPKDRGINLKPYLDAEKPHIAHIEDVERRVWLEQRYKHLVSNRPRHRLPYEIYHWEKIYKIDNKTRHMEPRRRPFETGVNPYKRRLDEHTPEYIPKCLRPGGPKSKPKWAKTYYP